MSETLFFVLELIGTIAFAASGAMVGLKKGMDIFGVAILGLCTAVGGGVIRDLVLGITPPVTFQDPVYALIAIATSIAVFLPAVRSRLERGSRLYDVVMLLMDSIGLGVFTVVGVQSAYSVSSSYSIFLLAFVGVITGVGGGVLRDVPSSGRCSAPWPGCRWAVRPPLFWARRRWWPCACARPTSAGTCPRPAQAPAGRGADATLPVPSITIHWRNTSCTAKASSVPRSPPCSSASPRCWAA